MTIDQLSVSFTNGQQTTHAVKDASLILRKGECLGIVGESGSGKSVTSLSILNLIAVNSKSTTHGTIKWQSNGQEIDLLTLSEQELSHIRGNKISMVFQEPMSSLNPVKRCGWQIAEVLKIHNIQVADTRAHIHELLRSVQLHDPARVYDSYPHELSGGQLQRVNIAMALAGNPEILICDEPTTALDVTIQKKIILLLKEIVEDRNIAMIFVCHDLDLVGDLCDRVVVMYQGDIVEQGTLPDVFVSPNHRYTKALLACRTKPSYRSLILPTVKEILEDSYLKQHRVRTNLPSDSVAIRVTNLTIQYRTNPLAIFEKKKFFKAVNDVSFDLIEGSVLGIVGESGSGKSTVAKCISGVIDKASGDISYQGQSISKEAFATNAPLRRKIQIIFQDPYSSLNPRMTIGKALLEPIKYHKLHRGYEEQRVIELLTQVGLDKNYCDRYPHQLSGGQRQRVCIARALAVEPEVLICDESVSALDVSVQAQILNLLDTIKTTNNLSIIFISHDLAVIHYISDQIIVMKEGAIVESGSADDIIKRPVMDYTKELVDSIPQSI